jgi:hypothetical protein
MDSHQPRSEQDPDGAAPPAGALPEPRVERVDAQTTRYVYSFEPSPTDRVEHDRARRVLRVVTPEGEAMEFHDRPRRFLVVEPDPETGAPGPVMSRGRVKVLYLCAERGE